MDAKRIITLSLLLVILASVVLSSLFDHGFWSRIQADFWPPDHSAISPNLIASIVQWVVVAAVATVVYPPFRKWVEREIDHVHTKLDHLIEHNPNVQNLPEHLRGRPWSKHSPGESKDEHQV